MRIKDMWPCYFVYTLMLFSKEIMWEVLSLAFTILSTRHSLESCYGGTLIEKLPRSGWPVSPSVGECLNDNCWRRAQLTVGCTISGQVVQNCTQKPADYKVA